jgi:hypothetical protein
MTVINNNNTVYSREMIIDSLASIKMFDDDASNDDGDQPPAASIPSVSRCV